MNFNEISEFFSCYSLPSVIIALIVAVISITTDKILLKKVAYSIRAYLPFLLGIVLYVLYDLIFVGSSPLITELTVSAGLMSGSLASIIFALIKKIFSGKGIKKNLSPLALLIESIVLPLVPEKSLESVVLSIEKLFDEKAENESILAEQIVSILSRHSDENTTELEIYNLAQLIVTGKSNLGKK